jgi:hypothetical protein
MKTKVFTITILIAFSFFTSCVPPYLNCIDGNGNLTTESRVVSNFEKVESLGSYNVYVSLDSVQSVFVEAESNILNYIETKVDNNTLIIKTQNGRCIDNHEPINIYVKTPYVSSLSLSGSGNIVADSLNAENMKVRLSGSGDVTAKIFCNNLNVNLTGSGDIKLSGIAEKSDIELTGSGNISSLPLLENKSFTTITGSGDVYISVSEFLDVKISGSGSVYYQGNPAVNFDVTGSGQIINYN